MTYVDQMNKILNHEFEIPAFVSSEAKDLVLKLVEKDPAKRIGCNAGGAEELKAHPFFRDIDWDKLYAKEITPPYIPKVKSNRDTTNFDEEFTSEMAAETPMETSALLKVHNGDAMFGGFSYTGEGLEKNVHNTIQEVEDDDDTNTERGSERGN